MNELLLCCQYCATYYLGVANWFKDNHLSMGAYGDMERYKMSIGGHFRVWIEVI